MELVVVNGANNIAKSVIRGLTASGKYSKVRLVDFRPYKKSVYALQRELRASGIELSKHQTSNVGSLEIGIEGAEEVVYFTHDYTSMTSDKNNTLVATAQLAKKVGVRKLVAVCPVELDLATSDDEQSWIEKRKEAEQKALSAHSGLSLLSTDLVFGSEPSHLVHYMTQCAFAGKIQAPFLADKGSFKPVAQADLTRAVTLGLEKGLSGQFAVQGAEEVTPAALMKLVETACGKEAGSTKARKQLPVLPLGRILEDLLVGTAIDTNMAEMLDHFATTQEEPVTGPSLWEAAGSAPEVSLREFYAGLRVDESDEQLVMPTFGSYKTYTD